MNESLSPRSTYHISDFMGRGKTSSFVIPPTLVCSRPLILHGALLHHLCQRLWSALNCSASPIRVCRMPRPQLSDIILSGIFSLINDHANGDHSLSTVHIVRPRRSFKNGLTPPPPRKQHKASVSSTRCQHAWTIENRLEPDLQCSQDDSRPESSVQAQSVVYNCTQKNTTDLVSEPDNKSSTAWPSRNRSGFLRRPQLLPATFPNAAFQMPLRNQ
jgi:hypothetical protein